MMGFGLFGLAHLDPSVASDPATAQAVFIGTLIGSQIPDIDTLYRLRGNNSYIRNHRGWTHSLPMLFLWPALISLFLGWCYPEANIFSLIGWTTLAVWFHVFVDLFNSYGTQAIRPLSKRWIHLHVLHIFDPFLFGIHLLGITLWWFRIVPPGPLFLDIYLLFFLYLSWRCFTRYHKLQLVRKLAPLATRHTVLPTVRWNRWYVLVEEGDEVRLGIIQGNELSWKKKQLFTSRTHPICKKSETAPSVSAFLSFSSYGYAEVIPHGAGYEVRWFDIRYLHKKRYPCFAVALLNSQLEVEHSFVGWMSHQEMCRKVEDAKLSLSS